MSPLEVDVLHNEITVTVPGTNYMATYDKPRGSRILIAKRMSNEDDRRTSMTLFLFLNSSAVHGGQRTTRHASSGGLCEPPDLARALAFMATSCGPATVMARRFAVWFSSWGVVSLTWRARARALVHPKRTGAYF